MTLFCCNIHCKEWKSVRGTIEWIMFVQYIRNTHAPLCPNVWVSLVQSLASFRSFLWFLRSTRAGFLHKPEKLSWLYSFSCMVMCYLKHSWRNVWSIITHNKLLYKNSLDSSLKYKSTVKALAPKLCSSALLSLLMYLLALISQFGVECSAKAFNSETP